MAFLIGQAAPSARPQIVVPGMMPIVSPISSSRSRSFSRPLPALMRSSICSAQAVPSRQGVHWPQLSWAKNRQLLCRKSTIDTVSSITTTAAVPKPRQPTLPGAVEIERRVELGFGEQAHADAAGDGRLGLCGPSTRRRRTRRSIRGR